MKAIHTYVMFTRHLCLQGQAFQSFYDISMKDTVICLCKWGQDFTSLLRLVQYMKVDFDVLSEALEACAVALKGLGVNIY